MKRPRGHPVKSAAAVLQVMWWADCVRRLWGNRERELIERISNRRLARGLRPKFLYDAWTKGTEPGRKKGSRAFFDWVEAIASVEGLDRSRSEASLTIFWLGDAEAFQPSGIERKLDALLAANGLARLSARETKACRRIRESWMRNAFEMPEIPLDTQTVGWAAASLWRATLFTSRSDWVTAVILSYREALLSGQVELAAEIKAFHHRQVMQCVDAIFRKASPTWPMNAFRRVLKRFKASLFDDQVPTPSEFESHRSRRRDTLPRAVMPSEEIRVRRAVVTLHTKGDIAAFKLMREHEHLWIHDDLEHEYRQRAFPKATA